VVEILGLDLLWCVIFRSVLSLSSVSLARAPPGPNATSKLHRADARWPGGEAVETGQSWPNDLDLRHAFARSFFHHLLWLACPLDTLRLGRTSRSYRAETHARFAGVVGASR